MGVFVTSEHDGHRMGQLIIDGELSGHVGKKLERNIKEQTRVHPLSLFRHRSSVTTGDPAQLILCWCIIHRRIFIKNLQVMQFKRSLHTKRP